MQEIVQKAHRAEKIWEFWTSNFFQKFRKSLVLCGFYTISSIFLIFRIFFQISPHPNINSSRLCSFCPATPRLCSTYSLQALVSAPGALCRMQSLSHLVSAWLGLCRDALSDTRWRADRIVHNFNKWHRITNRKPYQDPYLLITLLSYILIKSLMFSVHWQIQFSLIWENGSLQAS
jgi:hypothetical protein